MTKPKQPITAEQFVAAAALLRTAHDLVGTDPQDRTVRQYRELLDAVGELIRQDLTVEAVRVGVTAKAGSVVATI